MRVWTGLLRGSAFVALVAVFLAAGATRAAGPGDPPQAALGPPPLYYRLSSPWLDPEIASAPVRPQETSHGLAAAEVLALNVGVWGYDKLTGKTYADISPETWKQNLQKGWVVDVDDFWMNGLLHPVQGSFSYGAPRSLGVGFYGAFGYTFAASLLWEELGENVPPSVNDQINTPFGGALFGEVRFRLHRLILDAGGEHPGPWRRLLAFLIAPVAGANELVFKDRYRGPLLLPVSWIGDFSLGAVITGSSKDSRTGEVRNGLGPWAMFEAHVLYGVPGTPGLRLDHPFDHFSMDFSLSATADKVQPAISFLTRGLLLGDAIGPGDGFGGLWGLFASYDFFAARLFRATGFGLGPGVSLSKRWAGFNLIATGLVELVPWAGAGETIPLGSRDYDYGIGGEGLLALRLDLGPSVIVRTSLREFLVSDSYSRGRSEDITYARLGIWFRIWGPHAIGAESDWSRRNAQTELGPVLQRGWVLNAEYTLLSGW